MWKKAVSILNKIEITYDYENVENKYDKCFIIVTQYFIARIHGHHFATSSINFARVTSLSDRPPTSCVERVIWTWKDT